MKTWNIHHFAETESTNLLAKNGQAGDVFTAEHQSAGRGRLDHKWFSPPGENLMMSAVVDVAGMEPCQVATFPLVAGLAVAEALAEFDVRLKWPNDIVVASDAHGEMRKLAGILCELNGERVVAGIGVNVRQTQFAPEIARRATSLRLLGATASVAEVRDAILASLARLTGEWRIGGFQALLERISRIDALRGRFVAVLRTDDDGDRVCGMCGGIAPDGALAVGSERIYAGEAHVEEYGKSIIAASTSTTE